CPLEVAFEHVARVTLERFTVEPVDVAEHARHGGVLTAPGDDLERSRVGLGEHVGFLHARVALDRRTVEGHALLERAFELGRCDREALELAEHVGEPEPNEADATLLDGAQHVVERSLHATSVAGPSALTAARFGVPGAVNRAFIGEQWGRKRGRGAAARRGRPGDCAGRGGGGVGSRRFAGGETPDDGMRPAGDEGDDVAEQRTPGDVLRLAQDAGAEIVDLRFCDLPGLMQHFSMPIHELTEEGFDEGYGFDGSSIRGFHGTQESDSLLVPDPNAAIIDPFREHTTLSVNCFVQDPVTGEPYTRDPRYVARKAEEYVKGTGVADTVYIGPEAEFYIFDSARFDQNQYSGYYYVDSVEGGCT